MFKVQAPGAIGSPYQRDYEYTKAKREERKEDRQRRNARKGKHVMWQEAE